MRLETQVSAREHTLSLCARCPRCALCTLCTPSARLCALSARLCALSARLCALSVPDAPRCAPLRPLRLLRPLPRLASPHLASPRPTAPLASRRPSPRTSRAAQLEDSPRFPGDAVYAPGDGSPRWARHPTGTLALALALALALTLALALNLTLTLTRRAIPLVVPSMPPTDRCRPCSSNLSLNPNPNPNPSPSPNPNSDPNPNPSQVPPMQLDGGAEPEPSAESADREKWYKRKVCHTGLEP